MAKKKGHEIANLTMVRVQCSCGWFFRLDLLKGKTDEAIRDEVEMEFLKHQHEMLKGGY
jgi:hypothetical protein